MNPIAYSRCAECDSEILFMDGSRCAACLSAIQAGADDRLDEETLPQPEASDTLFDPVVGIQHRVPQWPLKRAA